MILRQLSALRIPLLCAILMLLAPCGQARAWGTQGHLLVGAIADRLIAGTPAEARVRELLGGDTLERNSVWSDCARAVKRESGAFRYVVDDRYPDCQPFEDAAGQAEFVRFVERNWTQCRPGPEQETCHNQYHYVNLAVQRSKYARDITGASDHDVVAAVEASIAVLRGRPAPPPFQLDAREALRVLLHSTSDLHQPFHVTSLYLAADGRRIDPDRGPSGPRNFTQGGNRLRIGERGNFHSLWDGIPPSLRRDAFLETAVVEARRVPRVSEAPERLLRDWVAQSLRQGRRGLEGVTAGPVDAKTQWQLTMPEGEPERREAIQREQLILAGAHVAALLQAVFPR